jgi:hypothetical protein
MRTVRAVWESGSSAQPASSHQLYTMSNSTMAIPMRLAAVWVPSYPQPLLPGSIGGRKPLQG